MFDVGQLDESEKGTSCNGLDAILSNEAGVDTNLLEPDSKLYEG